MRRANQFPLTGGLGAAIFALLTIALAAAPGSALGAKLVGGREQSAIHKAFFADRAHKGQMIVSIRASTVSPAWALVKSVRPVGSGRTSSHAAPIRLRSSYYHRARGARERTGKPPAKVRADLLRDFRLAVVYSGSGAESIQYRQLYRSVCAGAGGFTDDQESTVSPMSWRVSYVVDLDDILSAVRGSQGTTIVPRVSFDAGASSLSAVQRLTRTVVDTGCIGNPTSFRCTTTYGLGGPDPAGMLSFEPGLGLEVGIPLASRATGDCDPDDYTLGPSLWDSGAATGLVRHLDPIGQSLPGNPYAPASISWPGGSAQQTQGFVTSPCTGDAACSDRFRWTAKVTLRPA